LNTVHSQTPLLIVVGGTPATGKSTLAASIADDLGLLMFSKDVLKETLFDGPEMSASPELSQTISDLALASLLSIATEFVSRNVGMVLEADFRPNDGQRLFAPFLNSIMMRQVHCTVEERELEERHLERTERGNRHPVHVDDLEKVKIHLEAGDFEPLRLPIPLLSVNTTDGYHPSVEKIVASARTGFGASN
jgi:predicted kinase